LPNQELPSNESGPQRDGGGIDTSDPTSARNSSHNLFIAAAILLLLCAALMRTYRSSTTESSRTVSELTSEIDTAMQATKAAYALKSRSPGPVNPALGAETHLETRARRSAEDVAIAEWRRLAAPDHPVSTRRLGLTLLMFGRAGGLEVLLSVKRTARRGDGEIATDQGAIWVRGQKLQTKIPDAFASERAVWESLYGAGPIDVRTVPQLKAAVGKMNLGWFDNIALEQLYSKAGMRREADAAYQAAYSSATRMASTGDIEILLFLVGALMWLATGAMRLMGGGIDTGSVLTPNAQRPTPNFSYRARTTAFAVFLASYLFIGYPIHVLLPDTRHWSNSSVLRLSSILQIILYIPVVLLAIYTLRKLTYSESPEIGRLSFSRTLAALGMRTSNAAADIAAGVQGYVMVVPLFMISALISSRIFHAIHTPINPVQVQALSAIGPLDQLVMLAETALAVPIVEELMFRGLLFPALASKWGYAGGVILTSAVFGLLHPNLPAGFLPLWTLGAAFAVVFQRRQSLLPCIVMHSLHNGFVTIMMFMVFAK